jgi:hypothetical protein
MGPGQSKNDFGEYQQRRMTVRSEASSESYGGGREASNVSVEPSAEISANTVCNHECTLEKHTLRFVEKSWTGTVGTPVQIDK